MPFRIMRTCNLVKGEVAIVLAYSRNNFGSFDHWVCECALFLLVELVVSTTLVLERVTTRLLLSFRHFIRNWWRTIVFFWSSESSFFSLYRLGMEAYLLVGPRFVSVHCDFRVLVGDLFTVELHLVHGWDSLHWDLVKSFRGPESLFVILHSVVLANSWLDLLSFYQFVEGRLAVRCVYLWELSGIIKLLSVRITFVSVWGW